MKRFLSFALFAFAMFFCQECFTQDNHHCAHDHVLRHLANQHSSFESTLKRNFAKVKKDSNSQEKAATVYQIPVVFHVVYNTDEQNIPDEVMVDQIEILTQDFRRLNPNAAGAREQYLDIAGDVEIEFYLATEDPDGNPTSGINHVQTDTEGFVLDFFSEDITLDEVKFEETGGTPSWGNEYLNIWVCNIMDQGFGQVFGFAYPPNGAENWDGFFDFIEDDVAGVVMHYTSVGSNNPTADSDGFTQNDGGRTLTHEVGHFFGLRHIWGDGFFDGCNVDDGIDDTPVAATGANYVCDYTSDDCTDDDLPNMIENYMDYNEDICVSMFTQEQAEVMRFNLENYRPELIAGQTVSIEEQSKVAFRIYPNPSNGAFTLNADESLLGKTIEVRNLLGQVVAAQTLNSNLTADFYGISSGMYLVVVSGTNRSQQLIIK